MKMLVALLALIVCIAAALKGMIASRYEDEGGGGTWLLYPIGSLGVLASLGFIAWNL
jgi:uncharacterized membrane protein HdeD (DUF308 family)